MKRNETKRKEKKKIRRALLSRGAVVFNALRCHPDSLMACGTAACKKKIRVRVYVRVCTRSSLLSDDETVRLPTAYPASSVVAPPSFFSCELVEQSLVSFLLETKSVFLENASQTSQAKQTHYQLLQKSVCL